jgi:hypothetical protein
MSFLEGAGLEVGLGIAIGMLAGTTGTRGSARGRMTLLAVVIGLVVGYLLAGKADLDGLLGALLCAVGAAFGCIIVSDIVSGAGRRQGGGSGALGFLVSLGAIVVAAAALFVPVLTLIVVLALAWLAFARHRRSQRKHEGLRVLR